MLRPQQGSIAQFTTIIFDLDGTLYEDRRVYDRYIQELARFVVPDTRNSFLAEWRQVRTGTGKARVGMGYDTARDCLFRFENGRITASIDWRGNEMAMQAAPINPVAGEARQGAGPGSPPIETPLWGDDQLNIGDLWGIADVLAAHYGVRRADRGQAFLATRAFMRDPAYHLAPHPALHSTLDQLAGNGLRRVVMSNSPTEDVEDVLARLGIRDRFDLVMPAAAKPRGLAGLLDGLGSAERILCIGDNYVNDIEPALRAGGAALYIDRYESNLGTDSTACTRLPSIDAVLIRLGAQ